MATGELERAVRQTLAVLVGARRRRPGPPVARVCSLDDDLWGLEHHDPVSTATAATITDAAR